MGDAQSSAVNGQQIEGASFDDATLELLDKNQRLLNVEEVVELARILKLDGGRDS